ncbi:MAG: hypothetical protein J2P17_05110, partial [Mycobacterium sp.]|nr:hypothetical protein [Mycobacterium sp.]
ASAAKWVYHKAKAAVSWVGHKIAQGARWVYNKAAAAANWARQRAAAAKRAAIAAAKAVTRKAKAAAAWVAKHNPLPVIAAAVKPIYTGLKKVISSAAHVAAQVVSTVRNVVKDVAKAVDVVYQKAVEAAGDVVQAVSTAVHAVSEFAQAVLPAVAAIGAGLLTTAGCLAITGGAGSAGCIVAGFAVGGAVMSAMNCPPGKSIAGCAVRGAVAGAVGGLVFVATGGTGGGISAAIISGAASSAASSATDQFLSTGHVNAGQVATDAVVGGATAGTFKAGGRLLGGRLSGFLGRSCTGNSFTADTKVLMAGGTRKPISQVKTGDKVKATDPTTGKTATRTVTDTIVGTGTKRLVAITIAISAAVSVTTPATASTAAPNPHANPHGTNPTRPTTAATTTRVPKSAAASKTAFAIATITATDGHPFWVDNQHRWVDAKDLKPGYQLETTDHRNATITGTRTWSQYQSVYNLTIDTTHTYYVVAGTAYVLVHNAPNCRWKVGDDPFAPTAAGKSPAWSTVRGRFWKNEAAEPMASDQYGAANVRRMQRGLAPQRVNPRTGQVESMELSHEPTPFREGGSLVTPRWPDEHALIDPYRHTGG